MRHQSAQVSRSFLGRPTATSGRSGQSGCPTATDCTPPSRRALPIKIASVAANIKQHY